MPQLEGGAFDRLLHLASILLDSGAWLSQDLIPAQDLDWLLPDPATQADVEVPIVRISSTAMMQARPTVKPT
jgi:hypothetical protein